jgi:hypothetical protein
MASSMPPSPPIQVQGFILWTLHPSSVPKTEYKCEISKAPQAFNLPSGCIMGMFPQLDTYSLLHGSIVAFPSPPPSSMAADAGVVPDQSVHAARNPESARPIRWVKTNSTMLHNRWRSPQALTTEGAASPPFVGRHTNPYAHITPNKWRRVTITRSRFGIHCIPLYLHDYNLFAVVNEDKFWRILHSMVLH